MISHIEKAIDKCFLQILLVISLCMIWILYHQLSSAHERLVKSTALQHAAAYSDAIATFRTLYTSEVVTVALKSGVTVAHDYRDQENAIPLPATMSLELGKLLGERNSGSEMRLYSPYPFPWRVEDGGLQDEFAHEAWDSLSKDPSQPFYRIEERNGERFLCYATADRMRKACLNCHNTHPSTPKTGWKEGDLRGVLEISYPIDHATALAESGTIDTLLIVGPIFFLLIVGVGLIYVRQRRWSNSLETQVKLQTKDLRNQEQLIAHIYREAPIGLCYLDTNLRFIRINEWLANLTTLPIEEHYKRTLFDVFPLFADEIKTKLRQVIDTRKPIVRLRLKGNSGSLSEEDRVYEHSYFANTDRAGKVLGVSCVIDDVTAHMRADEERHTRELEINQSRKLVAVGALAAGIAHEINTPIQFVGDNTRFTSGAIDDLFKLVKEYREEVRLAAESTDYTNLLERLEKIDKDIDFDYLVDEAPLAIAQSLEGIDRVATIVRAMKAFSHMSAEEQAEADMNDALSSALTVTQNEIKYVADVVFEQDETLPQVNCYLSDLYQVFVNLLVNAAHAISDHVGERGDRGVITVSANQVDNDVEIKIKDNGKGIPKEIQERVFEQFYTTKAVGVGTGQGLSISRNIVVERHGGSLTLESKVGVGTTFTIRIPIAGSSQEPFDSSQTLEEQSHCTT